MITRCEEVPSCLSNSDKGVQHEIVNPDHALYPGMDGNLLREHWSSVLTSHPYYCREVVAAADLKKIPKKDRPDLAMEQNVLMTMDPALGYVPRERLERAQREMQKLMDKRAPIAGINWEERGPNNVGGRTRALMFDPNDPLKKKVWAGGVAGGLWYTNDITAASPQWVWVDGFWENIAITTMAFNPANTQEMYAGTGEGWFNLDAVNGGGIWKTTNGGTTWTRLPSTNPGAFDSGSDFHFINKIVIKPNGNIFVATRGYYADAGGIMRSTDGGVNWTRVKSVYNGSGNLYDRAADIEVAANGDLYASFGAFSDGKVFKSTNADNGATGTWTDLSSNVVIGNAQRIELACAPSDANVIYAVAHGGAGDNDVEWFKKSTNGGTSWSSLTIPKLVDNPATHFTRSQAWYDLILAVHPTNPNLVIAGGIDLHRSLDGGTTWTGISHWYGASGKPIVHADQHAIQFRPNNSDQLIFGHDGGVTYSTNAGNSSATPSFTNKSYGYRVTQFYACAMKNSINSNYFIAGSQDNGTQQFQLPQMNDTREVTGGDGGFCHIDQLNSSLQIASYTFNNVFRSLNDGNSFTQILSDNSGWFINPSDFDSARKAFYSAGFDDELVRITNMGITSPTINFFTVNLGGAAISALKVSPYTDAVYLGISNGRIYKVTNASTASPSISRLDNGTLATGGWVSSIDVGGSDSQLLVTYSNYGVTSLWETNNGGTNWNNKEGNLPDMPIRWTIYNPNNRNQVLAATELGVWTTDNFQPGTSGVPVWGPSNTMLANTRCDMLKYRDADKMVAVATHGKGLYTTDIFATTSVADFLANPLSSCSGSLTVSFTDGSLKPNGSWAWDVNSDGVVDYTTRNPQHTYTSPGFYSVTLSVNNNASTVTKEDYILVMNGAPAYSGCNITNTQNLNNGFGIGLYNVTLNSMNNSTPNNDGNYKDYACSYFTSLSPGVTYQMTITTGTANSEGARVYIDYNNNGVFTEINESVGTYPANTQGTRSMFFTVPTSGIVSNTPLRMRVISKFNGIPLDPCDTGLYGQAEDYVVYLKCSTVVTSAANSGVGTLRDVYGCATAGSTITFAAGINPTLTASLLFNKNITLDGNVNANGSPATTVTLNHASNGWRVENGKTVIYKDLSIKAGTISPFYVVQNEGNLTLQNTEIIGTSSTTQLLVNQNTTTSLQILQNVTVKRN